MPLARHRHVLIKKKNLNKCITGFSQTSGDGQMGMEAAAESKHRKETWTRVVFQCVWVCTRSCDSVTTARLLDLRDCCCQSLSPLFYCETTQVFPGVCVHERARLRGIYPRGRSRSHSRARFSFTSPSQHWSDCLGSPVSCSARCTTLRLRRTCLCERSNLCKKLPGGVRVMLVTQHWHERIMTRRCVGNIQEHDGERKMRLEDDSGFL